MAEITFANPLSRAIHEITGERVRQIDAEGFTPEHDDQHTGGEIADAAADWAWTDPAVPVESWASGKPGKDRRRQLVIAGALIVAELERLDRAERPQP